MYGDDENRKQEFYELAFMDERISKEANAMRGSYLRKLGISKRIKLKS